METRKMHFALPPEQRTLCGYTLVFSDYESGNAIVTVNPDEITCCSCKRILNQNEMVLNGGRNEFRSLGS